jgi:hypothetical protein
VANYLVLTKVDADLAPSAEQSTAQGRVVLPIFIRHGWPQAINHLSEIDGWAPCYPAFPQLALIHEWHRDGVNHTHPHQLTIAVYLRAWRAAQVAPDLLPESPAQVWIASRVIRRAGIQQMAPVSHHRCATGYT